MKWARFSEIFLITIFQHTFAKQVLRVIQKMKMENGNDTPLQPVAIQACLHSEPR